MLITKVKNILQSLAHILQSLIAVSPAIECSHEVKIFKLKVTIITGICTQQLHVRTRMNYIILFRLIAHPKHNEDHNKIVKKASTIKYGYFNVELMRKCLLNTCAWEQQE